MCGDMWRGWEVWYGLQRFTISILGKTRTICPDLRGRKKHREHTIERERERMREKEIYTS